MQKNITNNQDQPSEYHRFQVFQGEVNEKGNIAKTKSVGMAYLKSGQTIITLRLWTFSWDRYYILPSKSDVKKYLVMSREPNRNPNAKNKYYWNIVGNGIVDTINGVLTINFDLLCKTIYVNIHPETNSHSSHLPEFEDLEQAA